MAGSSEMRQSSPSEDPGRYGALVLGAVERDATVLFADIRGFTALAEDRQPVDVLYFVNRCFAQMVRCIREESGMLDKFLGDGLMAVFGLVEFQPDHVQRAARAAVSMQRAMNDLLPRLEAEGWENVGLGIGLESGRVVAGHVGIPERREFTVLGDVVNVASRLTAGAQPGEIVLGPGAASALGAEFPLASLGTISIRGRRQPVEAWRLAEEEVQL